MLLSRPRASTAGDGVARSLRNLHIDKCIRNNRQLLEADARLCGVDTRTFERQVRLHLPSIPAEQLSEEGESAYQAIRMIALVRSAKIGQETTQAELRANASLLLPKEYAVRRGPSLVAPDLSELRLSFAPVKPSIGNIYQGRLHYLRSVRGDTSLHYGLFLPGADHPLTYVALSVCDRPYMSDTLAAAQLDCTRQDCLVITRMYGLPRIPRNLMSLTLKYVVRTLRKATQAKILLTACNPVLGFDGAVFRASGFHPFATAPVSYWYTELGEFTTRRNGRVAYKTAYQMPPNMLMLRGIDRATQRELTKRVDLVDISDTDYQQRMTVDGRLPDVADDVWLKQLRDYRDQLQEAWSARTVHPSYLGEKFDPASSRGQCGVSSVWLANELRITYAVDSTYCYGDLLFPRGDSTPVKHHCWLEIGAQDDPKRLVIDLTCDQADGVAEPVLCAPHSELQRFGKNYVAHTRSSFGDLPQDRVWHRYEQLMDAMAASVESTDDIG